MQSFAAMRADWCRFLSGMGWTMIKTGTKLAIFEEKKKVPRDGGLV